MSIFNVFQYYKLSIVEYQFSWPLPKYYFFALVNIIIKYLLFKKAELMNKLVTSMLFFRGKMTVNPNTLNNEIHTYFFAHHWQQMHTQELFKKKKDQWTIKTTEKSGGLRPTQIIDPKKDDDKLQYTYQNWMKLINKVAQFNRFYVQCYQESNNDPTIQIMDFRGFRLFHDWDVWGDSTSYPQLKATAYFDSFDPLQPPKQDPLKKMSPIKPIPQIPDQNLYLTTKMGTNKCIMANQDTDAQGMSKLFAFNLNLNNKLKLDVIPSVNRAIHYRTVDTMPWSPSAGVHWFANGHIQPLYHSVDLQSLEEPLKNLLYSDKKILSSNIWAEMRMLQYRYNHPSKVSSVVGYLMNTQDNQDGKFSYINKYWRIVKLKLIYQNPNPAKTFNNNTNDHTTIEVFLRNVTYGNGKYNGILVDLSAAVLDGNNNQLFPLLPHHLDITINKTIKRCLQQQQVKDLFHQNAGMLLIQNALLQEGKITFNLYSKVRSNTSNYKPDVNPDDTTQVEIKTDNLQAVEDQFNIEIKDKFLKTKQIKNQQKSHKQDIDDKSKIQKLFKKSVTYDLYVTSYGRPFTGSKNLILSSDFDVDTSGLTQYTTNTDYLNTKKLDKLPSKRIEELLEKSTSFKQRYKSYQQIDKQVYQNKLNQIIGWTDLYIEKLYSKQLNRLTYTFKKFGQEPREFKLSFQQNNQIFNKEVIFEDGHAQVQIFLNQNLTNQNNPRHPALQSLCLVGKFSFQQNNILQNFTVVYYQNPNQQPYKDIDWLHTVGPKLKLMGLMYPSMQKIIDLYDYDGLSMNAMKRAFQIQDQNHSRYMPATRQMSSVTHRQIRRWLYNPIYDAHVQTFKPIQKNNTPSVLNFESGKNDLIQLLKQAFKIQLTTIPLYLSAMYSIKKEGEITKLIRSVVKDEMKHLFIVSNLINALGDAPPYPMPNQSDSKYIPQFPLDTYEPEKGLICFNFQDPYNKEWRQRMSNIPIQSSIEEQLLRFIMIEMPAQAYQIKIYPLLLSPIQRPGKKNRYIQFQDKNQVNQFINEYDLYKKTFSKEELLDKESQINGYWYLSQRINALIDAIEAVKRELLYKKKPTSQSALKQPQFLTIGMTYEKIMDYLWILSDINEKDLFNGNNKQQFTYMYLDNMTEIINHRTAMEQIRQIILEGEGSSIFSPTGQQNTKSHFIKFMQIFTGCDISIQSIYQTQQNVDSKVHRRTAKFVFCPNYKRFPDFPNYTKISWSKEEDEYVDEKVNSQLQYQRLSDRLVKTQFPNTFAPRSFLNGYKKILQELGFIFRTVPWQVKQGEKKKDFETVRIEKMENAIAKMRQMSLNASLIVHPNNTFDQKQKNIKTVPLKPKYPSASPNYNIKESSYLPPPIDPQNPNKK